MNEIKVVEVFMNDTKIGRIAMTSDSLCAFEYDPAYLSYGNSISPFNLPLRQEVFIAKRTPFNGGFGVFDDSLPDGWGNLILDRYLKSKGINPNKLTLLQRLALIGSTGRGALEYRPDYSELTADEIINFDNLANESQKMLTTDYAGDSLDTLYRYGDLLQLCHILTKNMEEVYSLFRQMVFNVAIMNRDDHAKNFSFQLINGEWRLSPAYDLLPCSGFNGFHTTTINNNGEPTADDMMVVASKVGLNKQRATEIIQEIGTLVKENRIKI
ncbi:type II toxin-antitoxin system HipA family toxin [Dysgonomonas sp.]